MTTKSLTLIASFFCFVSGVLLGSFLLLIVFVDGPLNIISNPLASIKIASGAVGTMFIINLKIISLYGSDEKFNFQSQMLLKSALSLLISFVVYHVAAVCFGAPVLTSVQETLHFAALLTVMVSLPCCLVAGPSIDNWLEVLLLPNTNTGLETVVKITSICAILGSWFGAVPIPLDWDRPWQQWPISCSVGGIGGYVFGLLAASLYLPQKFKNLHKTKLS